MASMYLGQSELSKQRAVAVVLVGDCNMLSCFFQPGNHTSRLELSILALIHKVFGLTSYRTVTLPTASGSFGKNSLAICEECT
jgi:hypothetical protein